MTGEPSRRTTRSGTYLTPAAEVFTMVCGILGLIGLFGGLSFAALTPHGHTIQRAGYVLLTAALIALVGAALYYRARCMDLADERSEIAAKTEALEDQLQLADSQRPVGDGLRAIAEALREQPIRRRHWFG